MKIRIIGPCGSGKSSLAKALSLSYDLPYYELDNVIWKRDETGLKYPQAVRDTNLQAIVSQAAWIVEGAQYQEWTLSTVRQADLIFILQPNVYVRDYRIIKRFIKSRTGIELWNYKQTFGNLVKMIVKWNHGYDLESLLKVTEAFQGKRHVVRNRHETVRIIQQVIDNANGTINRERGMHG
ncbi:hypothetical protein EBB07_21930 [Paenibacillaceae bacterium]|nr:hypothetical protein EBB07_21930 [Paenibacillaceae bacterium]